MARRRKEYKLLEGPLSEKEQKRLAASGEPVEVVVLVNLDAVVRVGEYPRGFFGWLSEAVTGTFGRLREVEYEVVGLDEEYQNCLHVRVRAKIPKPEKE